MLYLDYAASGPMHPEALAAMLPLLTTSYGNPSGIHSASRIAKDHLETAREKVAGSLGATAREIVFTGGGTEANALAILGFAAAQERPGHIVTTAIEHPAVKQAALHLEKQGHTITFLKPDRFGRVESEQVAEAITDSTFLVTVMLANNEIGTVQPYREIALLCDERGIAFHCDAVQAIGKIQMDLADLPVTSLALSGHKFGGPKGVGALFVRRGHRLLPVIPGGGQEYNRRSGTQNVAGAVGMATALEIAVRELESNVADLEQLRDDLIRQVTAIDGAHLTGHPTARLPHIASFRIDGLDGESLVVFLDAKGVCASTGSACSSGTVQASPVLRACGFSEVEARGSLRLSVGVDLNLQDIARVGGLVVQAQMQESS